MGTPARVLVFTGKGGVGKSTLAAATAVLSADRGDRVMIVSSDPAHSLSDVFGTDAATEHTAVLPGLTVYEPDARNRLEQSWESIRAWFVDVLAWTGATTLEAEELAVLPGMEELFALTDVRELAMSGDYDVVVVDCGPTAETIRLLSLPAVLGWYVDRVLPPSRRLNKMVGPLVQRLSDVPVPDDEVFAAADRFTVALDQVRQLLTDHERTSVRLVTTPERVVLAEARRTHGYLSLFGYGIDSVVVNRLIPDDVGPALQGWVDEQAERLVEIEEAFTPLPIMPVALADREAVGLEALRRLGQAVYGDDDPSRNRHPHEVIRLDLSSDDPTIEVDIPHAESGEVEVHRRGDELSIGVGPYRSNLCLPEGLRRRSVRSAAMHDGTLRISFDGGQVGSS
ncbi:MAG: ArsA family ATPase [Acidimicrobiales bacterium]